MQLEQQFDLPVPPAAAWPAFGDVPLLVSCLPGAALTGEAVDGAWPLRFDVKMGPMAAGFVGSGQATHDDAALRGQFEGAATDKRSQSRVKGAAAFSLSPTPPEAGGAAGSAAGGTRVTVVVDYTLTGPLAQFSRGGLVRELASALTAQFAANLAARLQVAVPAPVPAPEPAFHAANASAPASAAAPDAALEPAAEAATAPAAAMPSAYGPPSASPPAQPLNAGGLLWQVLRQRWRRLWAQLFHRASS